MMMTLESPFSGTITAPHIVVEKIVTCKFDEEVGETTYCIKWADTWLAESVVSCMFPELLVNFKTTEDHLSMQTGDCSPKKQSTDAVPLKDFTDSYLFYESLNVMSQIGPVDLDKSCKNTLEEALHLFTINNEHNELVDWVQHKEWKLKTENNKPTRARKTKTEPRDGDDENSRKRKVVAVGARSKRLRKPSAKKLASDELQTKRRRSVNGSECSTEQSEDATKCETDPTRRKKGRPSTNVGPNDPVECDICGKVVRKRRFENHRVLHSNQGKHQCDICGKVCGTRSDLDNHALIHGGTNFTCEHCGQKFKQPAPYRIHMKTHTVERNWMCDVCFQNFRFQGELKKHCLDDHADIALNPQQCCVCKEKLKSPISVYRHSVGHTGIRLFECGVCNKKFKHKSHLEKHLHMHERQEREKSNPVPTGPFQCEICGKQFEHLQSIKIHLGKHKANEENSLEEYLQKKAMRAQASKEKYRKNARVYKQKYKVMQTQKQRILKELGLDPGNPIVKTIDFKNLMKTLPTLSDDDSTGADGGCGEVEIMVSAADLLQHAQEESHHLLVEGDSHTSTIMTTTTTTVDDQLNEPQVEEVETNIVEEPGINVVIDTELETGKAVDYVVAEGSTVVVEHGTEVHEITMEDLDSGLTLLNFLRHGKAV